ncbi:DUF2142 domain-containing protein [Lacisediminihabitans profunda]|uniref:DUF2142 domain-containing protein n=1 Tax=Lacisediminihabitans profunda TaxID=2594790 RepID=A0A5C8UL98_9MICO|nr:DUF2142 domain-containing protein [Lacisediminihabitans profunda]TXN28243.1 DUF2142 domain-containing protein [Lacisediminihabitans profunda]
MTKTDVPARSERRGATNSVSRLLTVVIRSGRLTFLVTWAALSIASIAWAGSTPLGASPDEPAHIIKAAAVVRGEFIGELTSSPAITKVQVPIGLAQASSWPCYAFNAATGADCIGRVDSGLTLKSAQTSAGLYNPIYYAIVGLPSLVIPDTQTSVLAMRFLSGILSSLFLAFAFTGLLRLVRPAIAGAAFFTALTPMVLFLSGAVNPNSLEIATGAALTVGLLYLVLGAQGLRRSTVLGFVAASGFLMANARGLSPLWMAVIGIAVLVFSPWSRIRALLANRGVLVALTVMVGGVIFAGVWLLRTGTLSAMGVFPGAGKTSLVRGFYEMLVNRSIDPGIVGIFGWLDTPAPAFVYLVWSALFAALLAGVFALARGRALAGFLVALAALVFVPPVVQALSVERSGFIWQGRYTLVAFVFVTLFAAVAIGRSHFVTERAPAAVGGFVIVVAVAVFIGQVYSLTTAINRYSGTAASSIVGFLHNPTWAPPGGSLPWIALLALGMVVVISLWHAAQKLPEPTFETGEPVIDRV